MNGRSGFAIMFFLALSGTGLAEQFAGEGTLSAADATFTDIDVGRYYEAWTFEAVAGQTAAIEITSFEYVPGIEVYDPAGEVARTGFGVVGLNGNPSIWASEVDITATGTWTMLVTQRYATEGDYRFTLDLR